MGLLRTSSDWLYPEIEPYRQDFIKVSGGHNIYFEESGNPKGRPVVFLHGGPGGGSSPKQRRFFNPNKYRIILFDQRGCGKSTPHASVEANTTWDLVNDIEQIREKLGIERWFVAGGSWGSTLALVYAIRHSSRVMGLMLRGIFLCRREELRWLYQSGAHWLFPEEFARYEAHIPLEERSDFIAAYHRRLFSNNESERIAAARIWSRWEVALSALVVDDASIQEAERDEFALAFARIESHYFKNGAFFESDNFILENVDCIRKIPGIIVHGRYDVVCPVRSAWELHQAWPESELHIAPDAGHSAMDSPIARALVASADRFSELSI